MWKKRASSKIAKETEVGEVNLDKYFQSDYLTITSIGLNGSYHYLRLSDCLVVKKQFHTDYNKRNINIVV